MPYNLRVMRHIGNSVNVLFMAVFFGQFFSCYSPQMAEYQAGLRAEQGGNYVKAERHYAAAHEESPEDAVIVIALARIYVKLEDEPKAIEWYEKFLELTKDNDYSWKNERWEAEFYLDKAKQAADEASNKKGGKTGDGENGGDKDEKKWRKVGE